MKEQAVYQRAERSAFRVIGGAAVVVVIDQNTLHTLNEVGTRVWELLDGSRSLGEITDVIVDEFEVERPDALADVDRFVEELLGLGAVETRAR
jgi:hypothetical protein